MLKDFAWSTFEKTGDIQSYFFYREMKDLDIEKSKQKREEQDPAINETRRGNMRQ
jgi:hypothetical protein